MNSFFRKLGWLPRRRQKEMDLDEELRFHLEEEAEDLQSQGLELHQAQSAARRGLGNLTSVQENTRAAWTWTFLEQLAQDLRYAVRNMKKNRAFAALAALSLALGIGANTALYTFMDFLMMRSLPVADPASLVVVNWHNTVWGHTVLHSGSGSSWRDKAGVSAGIFPYPAYELLHRDSGAVFSSVFAYYPTRGLNLMVKGQAELVNGEFVSGEYFAGLEIAPAAGRLIIPADDQAAPSAVMVLGFAFAQKHFADPAAAAGQSIRVNNIPFTVIGVAPPGFFGVDPAAAPDYYLPLHAAELFQSSVASLTDLSERYLDAHYYWLEMMARRRPGVSLSQAQAVLAPQFQQWVATTAADDFERAHLPVLTLREGATGLDTLRREYSKPLYVLLAMVGLILAIACANIANLLLARAASRTREMAVRIGLGAGRFRVIRQLLAESALLSCTGGALGVVLALLGVRFLTVLLANGQDDFTLRPNLNWHVLGAAVGLSLLTGLLFGLAPALQSTRVDLMSSLKQVRQSRPRSRFRLSLSHALVVAQIAISLLMLVAAGLFVRTLTNLQSIQMGFNRENLLVFKLNARMAGHQDPEIVSFYGDLQKRLSSVPGVLSVSLSHYQLIGQGTYYTGISPVGQKPLSDPRSDVLMVGPGFFTTMRIPLLLGREIDERDQPGSTPVAVVSAAWAKAYFGERNPLGQHISFEADGPYKGHDIEVVGVAANSRYGSLDEDFPATVYLSYRQGVFVRLEEAYFILRTSGAPLSYVHTVRGIVAQADPRIPVTGITTQAEQIDQTMNQQIIFARLGAGFAILALVIACVGLYGTMAYTVARRTGEIGIRMALGAARSMVVWIVLRDVLAMAACGLAIGMPTAFITSKFVKSFLFGLEPNDPWAIALATAILMSSALLAGYLPARRAARIDPMLALRHE